MSKGLREELNRIYEQKQRLTAQDVLEVAQDPGHPLHGRFEWDDSIAGPKYRIAQAKELIRSCKIVYRDDTHPVSRVRAFQHVTRPDGPTYMPAAEAAEDPIISEVLKRQMMREFRAFKDRYKNWDEYVAIIRAEFAALDEKAEAS